MDKRADIVSGAATAFETHGFRGIGVDKVLEPSGASTRTLYKHFGSKDALVLAVLEERHRRFAKRLEAAAGGSDAVAILFDTLRRWLEEHGARGCMLLRARAEYSEASEEIVALVRRQKDEFHRMIAARVEAAVGRSDNRLATQIWVLFEGATAAASVADLSVIDDAKAAAALLVDAARRNAG
ncbi:TetR/AcrR family transcriptional regulator [Pseudoroseomonas ludipueritiae]|uniref:TetR/AcrR family transcriptional regulator n=1 Tax=Pseudoroseomonas ludipueritiae TaxID=198093 RepID=A0ABR7RCP8_9PROT|nr:TetR/AcrR family transcriptional regulator [Pseudoroseomonas ludipueritiae]MBC9179619.1 TetR/AcrR family transcriptional regulator [Pseudoroseomonas ludipueritiae]MCG7362690.1 TetR/AcrR family transcriptional regulator [Roseomonas sp. ACRSG]